MPMGGPAAGAPAAPDPMGGGMAGADQMGGGTAPAPGGDPMGGGMPGTPMAGGDPNMMGGGMGTDPMAGGDPNAMGGGFGSNGNGFDMGIGMTPEEDPKKYIEGAAAKIASELRKYQQGLPKPDMELNKTAVNTIAAATKTGLQSNQMDELMSSYADAMRRDGGDGSDGDNGGDANMDDTADQNTDATPEADQNAGGMAGADPMGGGDQNAMGGGMAGADPMGGGTDPTAEQAPLQERFNKVFEEFFKRKNDLKKEAPKGEIEQLGQRNSFTRKPFTAPIDKN